MRKKLFIFVAGLLSAGAVSLLASNLTTLRNAIELTGSETEQKECFKRIHYDTMKQVFYCGTCSFILGDDDLFSGKSTCISSKESEWQD